MSKYYDEEDVIAEYEKQLQKKDNEIERLDMFNESLIKSINSLEELLLIKIDIINKAIEYIEQYEKLNYKARLDLKPKEELLEILKGEKNV